MWHHLRVINEESFFNRDAGLRCIARINFLNKNDGKPLTEEIKAHWSNNPEPRINAIFEYTLVSIYKRIDVGFREEPLDLLIKFEGDKAFYVADPEDIYLFVSGKFTRGNLEMVLRMERRKVAVEECIIKVELDAINIGKPKKFYFLLKNTGRKMDDIKLEKLENWEIEHIEYYEDIKKIWLSP